LLLLTTVLFPYAHQLSLESSNEALKLESLLFFVDLQPVHHFLHLFLPNYFTLIKFSKVFNFLFQIGDFTLKIFPRLLLAVPFGLQSALQLPLAFLKFLYFFIYHFLVARIHRLNLLLVIVRGPAQLLFLFLSHFFYYPLFLLSESLVLALYFNLIFLV
jgi:hypothetical protein